LGFIAFFLMDFEAFGLRLGEDWVFGINALLSCDWGFKLNALQGFTL